MMSVVSDPLDAQKGEMRRQQVLDAAAVCFRRHGFHGTSIARICSEAGMSPGHIYHYFANKDSIVEAIARREEHDMAELAREVELDPLGGSVAERLTRLVDASLAKVLEPEHVQLRLELAAEGARNTAIHRILAQSDAIVLKQFIDAAERCGLPPGMDRTQLTTAMMMITAAFNGFMVRAATGQQADRQAIARFVKQLINALLEPAHAPP